MKLIKIERSDADGSYIERPEKIAAAMDGELGDIEYTEPGAIITLTVIEMDEKEYNDLPEFTGW